MAASSSVANDRFTYDVFLSFRGSDTHHDFTECLWKALEDKGIRTFLDKEDLREGNEITPELRRGIEESRMAIVVLSPNYASSAYCLEELSHILHCIEGRSQLVWPIFYEVEPSDMSMRSLEKGSYKEAMDAHKASNCFDEAKLEKWNNALHQVSNLIGFPFEYRSGHVRKDIANIVERVSIQIKPFNHEGVKSFPFQPRDEDSKSVRRFTYDVFLSFRGPDTRHVFTGSLWKALEDKGIRTFLDKEDLRKGNEITPQLRRAIEESRMAIVVLSPDYASSAFCLEELAHVLDCIKGRSRLVWPIFYAVEPSDLRWLETGSYKEAMDAHEASNWFEEAKLKKWKNALHQVSNLLGFPFKHRSGYLHEYIANIVEKVSIQIKPFTLYVGDNPVGLDPQIEAVKTLLNLGSADIPHMVEICGIGGIGKTTLSLVVHDLIAGQFDCSCFLPNVREDLEQKGMTYLQKNILSDTVGEKEIKLTSDKQGTQIMQQRLSHKKVLLILDDVDDIEKINAIVEKPEWFGPGSRVIITTRNTGMVTRHWVKKTHEMNGLNNKDALDLIRSKAFEPDSVSSSCDEDHFLHLLERAVTIASGLPLALEVIGSHLLKIGTQEWEYTLGEYEKIPDKKIQEVLKVSFNALQDEEKSVFLDISCCFKGYDLVVIEKILHAHHGDRAKSHLRVLVEKSLIKINEFDRITLHDLIEKMGREIVRLESWEDPGERSRLWCPEDIVEVLQQKTGTNKIEIICLDSSIVVNWDGEAFKGTTKLRTLIIQGCCRFSESPKHLPNTLKVFRWDGYPSPYLPVDFYPRKLAICGLQDFTQQDLFTKANKFESMRVLCLDCNKYLRKIPDISGLPNLEEFSFEDCDNLITVDDSVGLLGKLKFLNASNCKNLKSFPPLNLVSLEELDITNCVSLEKFPPVKVGFLKKLKILSASSCKIESFPHLRLTSLEKLNLSLCDSLVSFPLLSLASLEELDISHCVMLESFPLVVDGLLNKLKILNASNCDKLMCLPLPHLASLEKLDISNCCILESFPPVVGGMLNKLKILNARNCEKLKRFPLLHLPSLEELDISNCCILESFPPVVGGMLDKLRILKARNCEKLKSFPPLKLASLEELNLSYCQSLESFPSMEVEFFGKLKTLNVDGCSKVRHFSPLKLPCLEELNLSHCGSLENFPEILGEMKNIKKLIFRDTPIKELPFSFRNFSGLESLNLMYCGNVQFPRSIVEMSKLVKLEIHGGGWLFPKQEKASETASPSLKSLCLSNCNHLDESLATCLKWFANIERLDLSGSIFTTLPQCIENCLFLWELIVDDCEELEKLKGIPPSIKILLAQNCKSLSLSSKSKLLNQELHKVINTWFCLPTSEVPKWFEHKCMQGESFSFWFRNKFPAIVLCYITQVLPMTWNDYDHGYGKVIINGTTTYLRLEDENFRYRHDFFFNGGELQHLFLFHLQREKIIDNLGKALPENKWIYAEVHFTVPIMESGMHVLKEKNNMEDIRLTKPENGDDAPLSIDSDVDIRERTSQTFDRRSRQRLI